ncbi:MAG: hypothetical protein M1827_001209 [Pycnora praestabilis]|nr:MAG: hypothetical protein M1827_001209 [Pycnora praestabilis]
MLLGCHLSWSTTVNVVGTDEQKGRVQKLIIENNYSVGGAVNPRDKELHISPEGDELVLNRFRTFDTGGVVSDLTILEGVYEGTENHIFTIVKTEPVRNPIRDNDEESTVRAVFSPSFHNFYLGIARAAPSTSALNTPHPTAEHGQWGGDDKETVTEESYIPERYGNFKAHLCAAEALANRAGGEIAAVYTTNGEKRDVSARTWGDVAKWVASVPVTQDSEGVCLPCLSFQVIT